MDDIGTKLVQGSTYVFSKPVSGWVDMTESDKITAFDGVGGDKFVSVVGIIGTTIAVCARNNDITGTNGDIGSAYVFDPQPVDVKQVLLPIIIR